jgi:hypothetical protein
MSRVRRHAIAALVVAFVVSVNVPFAMLVERFGYDDVLREPAAVVLERFADGGGGLIAAWLAFGLGSLLFVPVALALARALRGEPARSPSTITVLGLASAILQSVGLLRWVFVVPGLAALHADPATDPATRAAAVVGFELVHQYGGVLIGEFLGQLLLVAWTVGTSWPLLALSGAWRALGIAGLAISVGWLIGFSELLATALPGVVVVEAAPVAFMAWEAWLVAIAVVLVLRPVRSDPSSAGVRATTA